MDRLARPTRRACPLYSASATSTRTMRWQGHCWPSWGRGALAGVAELCPLQSGRHCMRRSAPSTLPYLTFFPLDPDERTLSSTMQFISFLLAVILAMSGLMMGTSCARQAYCERALGCLRAVTPAPLAAPRPTHDTGRGGRAHGLHGEAGRFMGPRGRRHAALHRLWPARAPACDGGCSACLSFTRSPLLGELRDRAARLRHRGAWSDAH